MADARSLLRQQRAARQQAQASHKPSTSKKRKAADGASIERKRTRTEEEARLPAGFFDAGGVDNGDEAATQVPDPPAPIAPPPDAAAEAELDAFLDEMKQPQIPQPQAIAYSGAVIEAAPMTAAEIAAQAREEQSAQRARRDEEMEGEKEDAARALQDEFDEMDGLEERVKSLRQQREALRVKRVQQPAEPESLPPAAPADNNPNGEDDDESEEDDWDDWRFRPA